MNEVIMPRVSIVPGIEQGTSNVILTKPNNINAGNPSAFPFAEDKFKGISYQTPNMAELQGYYAILSKITSGQATSADLVELQRITSTIREYILTDEDYNLVVGALQEIQGYIIRFMYNDISAKAEAMDVELNKVITDINTFMTQLETIYSKSPSSYPIPDNSVLRPKLETNVQKTLNYTDATNSVIVSATKPANPQGRAFIWFNTGTKI